MMKPEGTPFPFPGLLQLLAEVCSCTDHGLGQEVTGAQCEKQQVAQAEAGPRRKFDFQTTCPRHVEVSIVMGVPQ